MNRFGHYFLGAVLGLTLMLIIVSAVQADESHGIEPWQDADKAMKTVPTVMVTMECEEGLSLFGAPEKRCQVIRQYIWVPDLTGILAPEKVDALFCLQLKEDRLVQCFYSNVAGQVLVVPIKYRGERL